MGYHPALDIRTLVSFLIWPFHLPCGLPVFHCSLNSCPKAPLAKFPPGICDDDKTNLPKPPDTCVLDNICNGFKSELCSLMQLPI